MKEPAGVNPAVPDAANKMPGARPGCCCMLNEVQALGIGEGLCKVQLQGFNFEAAPAEDLQI